MKISKIQKITLGLFMVVIAGFFLVQNQNRSHGLVIGLICGVTGDYAEVGNNWVDGVRLAKEQYMSTNPKITVKIIEEDSGFDTKKGVTAYKKLKGVNDIDALINCGTFTINGIYDEVTKEPFPVIQGGEQSTEPTDDNVFQVMQGNITMQKALGEHLSSLGYGDVGVFMALEATYIRFVDAIEDGFGRNLTRYVMATDDISNIKSSVTLARDAGHDAIVFSIPPVLGARIIKEMNVQMAEVPKLAFDATYNQSDYERILGDLSMIYGSHRTSILQANLNEEFVESYKDRYNREPGFFSDHGYDAFNLLVKTYNRNGEKWIKNIKNADMIGVGGPIIFDAVGVRTPEFEITQITNDRIE